MTMISSNMDKYGGATIRGKSHKLSGLPNQDAFLIKKTNYGIVLAVADGVGSQAYSQFGSAAIVTSVEKAFSAFETHQIERKAITKTAFEIFKGLVPQEYKAAASTTCIFAVLSNQNGLFLGVVGDGLCVVRIGEEEYHLKCKDEPFSNIVTAVNPSAEMPKWTTKHFDISSSVSIAIMLATDGISGDIIPGKEFECLKYFVRKIGIYPQFARNAILKREISKWGKTGSNDDKTVIVFSRK